MVDRGRFWSPIPEWRSVSLDRNGVRIAPVVDDARMQVISGDPDRFLSLIGLSAIGPRDRSDGRRYALRLAPDRLLSVGDATPWAIGWSADGYAVSNVTDGYLRVDVLGSGADDVMAFGGHYDWYPQEDRPLESAVMLFAGLKTVVGRLESGWRLHIERSLAPALWRWLEQI